MAPQDLRSTDSVDVNQQTDIPITSKLPDGEETPMEPEEDEDDDIDFNPFLRASPAAEASSSLSSEVEGLDHGAFDGGWELAQPLAADSTCKQIDFDNDFAVDNSMLHVESTARKRVALEERCDKDPEETANRKYKKGKSVLNSEPDMDSTIEKENGSSSGTDVINDVLKEDANIDSCRLPIAMAMDDEDAICKRTRARYSLAGFTLDELETFLQETDDDDDLQNVDDEEEYRKFLASVLQGGVGDDQATLDNGNDEDEDNDADFEIEIEEALESDVDDCLLEREKLKGARRRPETRQNRRQKAFSEGKRKLSEQGRRPLRPLLPILPGTLIPPVPSSLMVETSNMPMSVNGCSLNGFTPHQLGQLYCLIHEHVQLLIQVFSLCVLEPSRRTMATQIQGLLSEMLDKRDQVLTWRNFPHPSFCFGPPYLHPSALDELPIRSLQEGTAGSHEMNDEQREQPSSTNKSQGSTGLQSSNGFAMKETPDSFQALHGSSWLPFVGGPVLSILDVAPLKFVKKYMDDVSAAVQEQMRRYVEATSDVKSEKQPLFPLPTCSSFAEADGAMIKGVAPAFSSSITELSSSCLNQRPAKKTLAATLVESSKKQSVALVPKRIAELAAQFYPFFNPALFPHKPPPLAVANRVLFTDAEDELLAVGLMEYNTDWKAIQQRFLPCKSKHQIFVRQKNRCSSKAPDNPIKDVRRLKTSPLTDEEKARIEEGLTVYKLDWMSIWKLVVPYRDPSLLPRQWRIALGTQKSYKIDPTRREKRRIYESNRRRNKVLAAESLHASDKEDERAGLQNDSGEECMDNNNEAYVHEAFLADWRPAVSVPASEVSTSNLNSRFQPALMSTRQCSPIVPVPDDRENHGPQKAGYGFHRPYNMDPNCPTSTSAMASSTFASYSRPYRARRPRNSQLVRLAPSLPPVNLPPTVRVISQAAFQNSQLAAPNQAASASAIDPARRQSAVSRPARIVSSAPDLNDASQNIVNITADLNDTFPDRENGIESDLQLHPLLFQPPGNGHLPYYPLSSGAAAPNSFCFFPTSPYQSHLAPLQNPGKPRASVPGLPKSASPMKSSCSLDFHPLLQRTDNANNGSKAASQRNKFSTGLEPSKDPISPSVAANELDLEFNLNSASRKEKDTTADETEVFLPGDGGNICATDSVNDQSLPDIVMEQEELSDSVDEIDHVEFECEEMADSEGEDEEFYSHPVTNSQNKQRPIVVVNRVDTDQHCEPPMHENPESPKSGNGVPLQAMDPSGPAEDMVRSPWLSLNSQVCHDANYSQAKSLALSSGAGIVSNAVASHLTAARNITSKESSFDVQSQAEHVAVTARLPRKRTSRGLNMDVGASSCGRGPGG